MRDYTRANDLEEDSDAVMRQMKEMLDGPSRTQRSASQRPPKGANLALALVHTLRGDMRGIGGLDAPEELVLEAKSRKRAPVIAPKPVLAEPEPKEAQAEPAPEAPVSMEPIGPEPGPEPSLEPEPELEPETDFVAEPEPVESKPAPMASVEPLFEREPQKMPRIVDLPKPKTSKLTAGDDEDDDDDEPGEDDDEDEGDDDEPGPPVKMGRSKKLLLKLLKRMAKRRKGKSVPRSRKPGRSRPKSRSISRRRK
jgi:hypothetical protein